MDWIQLVNCLGWKELTVGEISEIKVVGSGQMSDEARKWGPLAWEDVELGSRSQSQWLPQG